MTIRDQIRTEKNQKIKAQMQEEREKRLEAELKECQRKFKANPVPSHVYLPLYEQRKLDEKFRQDKLKKMSKEYAEKVVKPFNLTDQKNQKNQKSVRERRHSYSEGQVSNRQTLKFNAQPLPEFYNNEENFLEK